MKNRMMECLFVKPLSFLRIWGTLDGPADEVKIYLGLRCIGLADVKVYVKQERKEFFPGQINYVFHRVIKDYTPSLFHKSITVVVRKDGRTVSRQRFPICLTEELPKDLVSSIGTKSGIIINDAEKEAKMLADAEASGFKPPLKLLHIESSSLCNLRCRYCVVSNNYECIHRSVMREDVLDKAIDVINRSPSMRTVQVSGLGEPLTNPNFIHILERIQNETKIRHVWFFTNGMLLTREIAEKLVQLRLDLRIVLSIDGKTPEENNFYRNGSDYETVREHLNTLLHLAYKKPNFTIQIHNLIVTEMGAPVQPPEFLLNDFGQLRIDTHRAFYFPELSSQKLKQDHIAVNAQTHKRVCKRMYEQATIRSTGDVVRCHWDSTCSIVMGNVLETDFYDIWHGQQYCDLRRTMLPDVPFTDMPEACQKCHAMNEGFLYKDPS